jgi:hypothetical protein
MRAGRAIGIERAEIGNLEAATTIMAGHTLLMLTGQRRGEIGGLGGRDQYDKRQLELHRAHKEQSAAEFLCRSCAGCSRPRTEFMGADLCSAKASTAFELVEGGCADDACGVKEWTVHDLRRICTPEWRTWCAAS